MQALLFLWDERREALVFSEELAHMTDLIDALCIVVTLSHVLVVAQQLCLQLT